MKSNYELAERTMLLSLARNGNTFLDIGANEGLYAIEFAKKFKRSLVFAFEPIPGTAIKLQDNIKASGLRNVSLVLLGLSDSNKHAQFYVSEKDSGATSMAPLEGERFGKTHIVNTVVTTLDDYVLSVDIYPSIIKCDVEGAELLVFRGAARTISQDCPVIQCEMLRKWAARFDYHPNDLIAYLAQFGYQCYRIVNGKLERFLTMTDDTVTTNFYFLHPTKHKELLP